MTRMAYMTRPERQFYIELGERIRDMRQQAGLSQLQLARRVGLQSGVAIHYWETGSSRPTVYLLERLDAIFGEGWRA